MALYFSTAQRARRIAIIALLAALLAFLAGWAYGRQQVPTIESRVAVLQEQAASIAIGIERLDIEYEQTLTAAGGDSVEAGVIVPLDELRTRLQTAMDDAPWLTPTQRSDLLDDLAAVRSAANSSASVEVFRSTAAAAAHSIRNTFGVS